MTKFISRIVGLFLIPCLLADPSLAVAWNSQNKDKTQLFYAQALACPVTSAHSLILKLKSTFRTLLALRPSKVYRSIANTNTDRNALLIAQRVAEMSPQNEVKSDKGKHQIIAEEFVEIRPSEAKILAMDYRYQSRFHDQTKIAEILLIEKVREHYGSKWNIPLDGELKTIWAHAIPNAIDGYLQYLDEIGHDETISPAENLVLRLNTEC